MPDPNDNVMELVARELDRNPDATSAQLYRMAMEADPEIANLSLRQFHARYPLQIKRSRARASGGRRRRDASATRTRRRARGKGAGTAEREALRGIFLQFASDFAKAESRSEIVRVLSNVDTYVDRAEEVFRKR